MKHFASVVPDRKPKPKKISKVAEGVDPSIVTAQQFDGVAAQFGGVRACNGKVSRSHAYADQEDGAGVTFWTSSARSGSIAVGSTAVTPPCTYPNSSFVAPRCTCPNGGSSIVAYAYTCSIRQQVYG
jgi:hypothetical protein